MEKKRKLSYERGKCVELPQAKLKKIFLQTKQINGSREDGRGKDERLCKISTKTW